MTEKLRGMPPPEECNQLNKLTLDNAVLTCIHVLEKTAKPEYSTEDDSYVCTKCRDEYSEKGFEETKHNLRMVHRGCLIK